jgi:hypothetical protein
MSDELRERKRVELAAQPPQVPEQWEEEEQFPWPGAENEPPPLPLPDVRDMVARLDAVEARLAALDSKLDGIEAAILALADLGDRREALVCLGKYLPEVPDL